MQQTGLTKQQTPIAIILWFIGICATLAFIGTILTITVSVDHVVYPFWIKVIWDTTNVLLLPVAYLGVNCAFLFRSRYGKKAFLDYLFLVIAPTFCMYQGYQSNFLSLVLFTILIVLTLLLWIRYVPTARSYEKSPTRLDGADDLPALPIASPGVIVCCSICKVQNPYDICLDCEINHKTEIHKVRSHNMRAKKAGEPATLTIAEWLQTLAEYQYRCAYCDTGKYEALEHYFPLGSHDRQGGTTALNCVPSCRKCNLEKSNKHPEK